MIIPQCGHDTDKITFPAGSKWQKGQCAHCWQWLNRPAYRKQYEEGPPIHPAPPRVLSDGTVGLGDTIKGALDKVGITQEKVGRIMSWLGLPCNCPERQEKMNGLSQWASRVTGGKTDKALHYLNEMLGINEKEEETTLKWAYGITACMDRKPQIITDTIASLKKAGFDQPTLFVDGCTHQQAIALEASTKLEVVSRYCKEPHPSTGRPVVGPFGNWVLSLWEVYLRNPHCDRYAIFQDDLIACAGPREYLNQPYPEDGYWNLYTSSENQGVCPRVGDPKAGSWIEGWYSPSIAWKGLGALGLVFDKKALLYVLQARSMAEKPQNTDRGWRNVDGAVYTALDLQRYKEYVHNPSLLQHTGTVSTVGNGPNKKALSFKGENWDARSMLKR